MTEILKDMQVLACEKLTEVATEGQVKEIEKAIKEMNDNAFISQLRKHCWWISE